MIRRMLPSVRTRMHQALLIGVAAIGGLSGFTASATPTAAGEPLVLAQNAPAQDSGQSGTRFNWPSAWPPDVTRPGDAPKDTAKEPAPSPPPANTGPAPSPSQSTAGAQTTPPAAAPSSDTQQPAATPEATPAANGAATPPAPVNGEPAPSQPATVSPPAAPAEQVKLKPVVSKNVETARTLATRFETLEKSVERVRERDEELTNRLPQIEAIISEAESLVTRLRPELADIRSQIEKLGPAPEGEKSESQEIASERQRLNAVAAEIDGAIRTAELTQVRARQLITRVQVLRLDNFRRSLFTRSYSFLSPVLWQRAVAALPEAGRQIATIFDNWIQRVGQQLPAFLGVVGATLFVGFGLQILSRRIRRKLRHEGDRAPKTFPERALVASLEAPLRLLPKVTAAAVAYAGLDYLNLLYLQVEDIANALFKAIIILAAGTAFTTAYLQPARPDWRLIDLGDQAAWRVRRILRYATILFAIDVFAREVIGALFLPLSVNILWTSIVSLLFAALFVKAARTDVTLSEATGPRVAFLASTAHKLPLALVTLAIFGGILTGYAALAHYAATRTLIISTAAFLIVIFYLSNRAIAAEPDSYGASEPTSGTENAVTMPIGLRRRLARGLSIVLDIVLFLLSVPLVLLAVGFDPAEITTLSNRALFGFEIGGVEISLVRIGFAIGFFAAIILLTGMLQRWLGETVLHPSRTEQGLGNSIRTGVGYLGFIAAALVGLSYAGLDITNLAIVAGALSVGIGFGLQSIVNNFVSGLILLVERPIKVGDWIKVGDISGYVRRISVRSTEIETFDRASVIIPNSELISGTVTNLTLRNALGRITIPVGVSYGTDPEVVQKVLLECAAECKSVARHPAPFVVFEDFGASSLDFSLRFFVSDVSSSLSSATEVRMSILKRFREHGIEIPFPQRDLNLRDLSAVRGLSLGAAAGEDREPDIAEKSSETGSNGGGAPAS